MTLSLAKKWDFLCQSELARPEHGQAVAGQLKPASEVITSQFNTYLFSLAPEGSDIVYVDAFSRFGNSLQP